MKKLLIAALAASQTMTNAAPAFAQAFAPARETEAGAFAGVRIRLSLGGPQQEPLRAGFAFAPTVRTDYQDGRTNARIGEGLEFGFSGSRRPQLSLAGMPVNRLAPGRGGPEGERLGISTLGWVGIGVGVLLVAVVAAGEACRAGDICGSDRDD